MQNHRTHLRNKLDQRTFYDATVVITTDETLYPLTVFDARRDILCLTLVSLFS